MTTRESEANPFLQGNFAPIESEDDVESLQVIGEIPREFLGLELQCVVTECQRIGAHEFGSCGELERSHAAMTAAAFAN